MVKINSNEYDKQWAELDSFIKHNPGARHRRRFIYKLVEMISPSSVVDVGCGRAQTLLWLKYCFPDLGSCEGLDFAKQTIEQNRVDFPSFKFNVLDIENSRVDSQYEFVICSEVIEHLSNQEQAFANLAKMVETSGYLLLTCPTGTIFPTQHYFGHVKHPSLGELRKLAQINQLEIIKEIQWGWPIYTSMQYLMNLFPNYTVKTFAKGKYSILKVIINKLLYYINFLNISSSKGCQLVVLMKKKSLMEKET